MADEKLTIPTDTPPEGTTVPTTEGGEGTTTPTEKPTDEATTPMSTPEKPKGTEGGISSKEATTDKTEDLEKPTTPAEFDVAKYETEFLETGDLSEESVGELYKQFPKNLVDMYLDNMKKAFAYEIAKTEEKAFKVVGGEENYVAMMQWATKNLSKEEINAFNELVGGNDELKALTAIKGLHAQMQLATVRKPSILMGENDVPAQGGDTFLTRKDYANAIGTPEYQNSPQYRAQVDEKLRRTLKLGGFKA